MTSGGLAFVIFVTCAFSLFGGVLFWATWTEERHNRRKSR